MAIHPGPLQVVIADPMPIVRAGLRVALAELSARTEFVEVVDTPDMSRALPGIASQSLVIASAELPGSRNVLELCRLIGTAKAVAVIMLPAADAAVAVAALHAGAAGVILKSSRAPVIAAAMQVVLAGGRYLCPAALLTADAPPDCVSCALGFIAARTEPASSAVAAELTARQREVLHLLGEGLSNKEIARQLGLKVGTVKIHVARILQVLNAPSRAKAVALAQRIAAPDRRARHAAGLQPRGA